MFSHCREIAPDTTKGNWPRLRAESPRDFLLNLHHSEILFRTIVRKWHAKVGQETEEGGRIALKPIEQVLGLALFDSAFLFGWGIRRRGQCSQTCIDKLMVGGREGRDHVWGQMGFSSGTSFFYLR